MAIPRLLVVDDDVDLREMLTQFLRRHGYAALPAATGAQIDAHLATGRIDLVLLDVMLGDESGVEICAGLRRDHAVPIILISALSGDHNRMEGYAAGADDYIAKPFNPDLLLARVRAVLRRVQRTPSLAYRRNTDRLQFEGWVYDGKTGEVRSPQDFEVALSRREAALLRTFLANPHVPLTREEIAAALDVTGDADPGAAATGRAIDMLVGRLRSKIEENPRSPRLLRTERGVGYVFAADVTPQDG